MMDGTVNDFVRYGILYQANNLMYLHKGMPYGINDWAWGYLNKHPDLVQDEYLLNKSG